MQVTEIYHPAGHQGGRRLFQPRPRSLSLAGGEGEDVELLVHLQPGSSIELSVWSLLPSPGVNSWELRQLRRRREVRVLSQPWLQWCSSQLACSRLCWVCESLSPITSQPPLRLLTMDLSVWWDHSYSIEASWTQSVQHVRIRGYRIIMRLGLVPICVLTKIHWNWSWSRSSEDFRTNLTLCRFFILLNLCQQVKILHLKQIDKETSTLEVRYSAFYFHSDNR